MRLLLIEDDELLARGIATALSQAGYVVETAASALDALRLTREGTFNVAVLDLGLPDRDGIELLRDMRSAGVIFPILILSARDGLNDRIHGLDAGADDYLVKPFALGELEARLRAIVRRPSVPEQGSVLGRLHFDFLKRRASVAGEDLVLTARELAILEAMLKPAGKIVSKQALFDAVFPSDSEAAPNALEVHISRLRHKLSRSGAAIRSIRGLGYRLEECPKDETHA